MTKRKTTSERIAELEKRESQICAQKKLLQKKEAEENRKARTKRSSGNIIAFKAKEAQNRSYDVSEPAYGLVPENSRHEYVDMPKIGLSSAQKTGHTVVTHLFKAK